MPFLSNLPYPDGGYNYIFWHCLCAEQSCCDSWKFPKEMTLFSVGQKESDKVKCPVGELSKNLCPVIVFFFLCWQHPQPQSQGASYWCRVMEVFLQHFLFLSSDCCFVPLAAAVDLKMSFALIAKDLPLLSEDAVFKSWPVFKLECSDQNSWHWGIFPHSVKNFWSCASVNERE